MGGKTNQKNGLTQAQAALLLQTVGPNVANSKQRSSWVNTLVSQFKSPFTFILIGASLISLVLGEVIDGVTIIGIVCLNGLFSFVQEYHSKKTAEKLQKIIEAKAAVRRDGQIVHIPNQQVVPGDILIVRPGTILAADVKWLETDQLQVDESLLTGESIAVVKNSHAKSLEVSLIDGLAGTRVLTGYGEGQVMATGPSSSLGKIVQLTTNTQRVSSFEQGLNRLSHFIVWMVGLTLTAVFLSNLFLKGTDQLLSELLFSIALAVSVIPEALPAVTTITFTKGAILLEKKKVIVKRLSAIEDLGHIQVLCTDKTGTLTENKMKIAKIQATDPEQCLLFAFLASEKEESSFDAAILEESKKVEKAAQGWKSIWKIPFDPDRKRSTVVVQKKEQQILISKGAPEVILASCSEKNKIALLQEAHTFGVQGFRVIAVAVNTKPLKTSEGSFQELSLKFLGFIAFEDPLKATAGESVRKAQDLGVEVKILTGDSPEVAKSIALQIGIMQQHDSVVTGEEFQRLSSIQKQEVVLNTAVFARVTPEDKYSIIQHLQHQKVVGFLGEGMNDAPGLQLATVGLVVQHASDVAREAADIILLDRSLHVIIEGIIEGRRIFANVSKYIRYTLIGNFGNFYAIAGISLLIPFLPMLPSQILLTNLLTDLPLILIAVDTVDATEIHQPKLFSIKEFAILGIVLGLVSSLFDFIFFALFRGQAPPVIQTLWCVTSILTELALIFSIRTHKFFAFSKPPKFSLMALIMLSATIILVLPYIPLFQEIFHFIQPTFSQLIIVGGIVTGYLILTESVKLIYYKSFKPAVQHEI